MTPIVKEIIRGAVAVLVALITAGAITLGTTTEAKNQARNEAKLIYQQQVLAAFPTGVILPFYATSGKIPDGWAICDGTNHTPDLRNKFLRGTASMADVTGEGGADSYTDQAGGESLKMEIPVLTLETTHKLPGSNSLSLRVIDGYGIINYDDRDPNYDVVRSFTQRANASVPLPKYHKILYIMKR
jgi:hypothetical protein